MARVQTLEEAESAKLLGVDIDSKLTFNNHVDSICKQANSTVLFFPEPEVLHQRYLLHNLHNLRQATVEYASTVCVWDPHICRNTNKLE